MNPNAIARFSKRAALMRAEVMGVLVVYRGAQVRLACASREDTLVLESGGQLRERAARIRIPTATHERPVIGDEIVVVKTGIHYVVRSITDPIETAAEWVAELSQP